MKLYKRGGMSSEQFIGVLMPNNQFYFIDRGWVEAYTYGGVGNRRLYLTHPVSVADDPTALRLFPVRGRLETRRCIHIPRTNLQHLKTWEQWEKPDIAYFMQDPAAFLALEIVL